MNHTEFPDYFGEWLKRRRKALDLTQAELAQQAGCSVATLWKIEAGERRPSKQLASLLARFLEIPSEHRSAFIKAARGEGGARQLGPPEPGRASAVRVQAQPSLPRVNLPLQPTSLVGREAELAVLGKLLADPACRMLTLTGLGGVGKTRLAIEAAFAGQKLFPDGVAFISLAALTSPAFIASAIAEAAGFKLVGSEDPKKQLLAVLQEKSLLLVLDNAESLLDEVGLFTEMLVSAPRLKLLVTSRERLNLQSEWVFEVQGLPVPADDQVLQIEQFSSVTLFVERARQVRFDFTLGLKDQRWVARICRMVEGMPLGIELAAAWVSMLTCQEIAEEIERSLDFLSATVRDLPERQRSMRVVLDYSWQMLAPDEQRVLCQLSVFQGGFQRQAAEQVAGATLPILSNLVSRTLLRRAAAGRYDMHELVRQYSTAVLAADPAAHAAAHQQHFDLFLSIAEMAGQGLRGPGQQEWLERLEQDHDNLRVALEWALASDALNDGHEELGLRLSGALSWFWRMRGHFHEGRDWLVKALHLCPDGRTAARAGALLGISLLMNGLGDLGAARPPAEESAEIYRELGQQLGLAEALTVLGLTLVWQGEAELGRARLEEALTLYRKAGDRWGEAWVLYRLGSSLADYGGDPAGRAMLAESAAILDDLGEQYVFVSVLTELGIVEMGIGDYAAARVHFEHSLSVAREIGHPWGLADALTNLGGVFRIQGDYAAAQLHFEEAQRVYQKHGRSLWETDVLCAQAENAISQGDFSTAGGCLQAAYDLSQTSENKWLQTLISYFRGLLAYYQGDIEAADLLLSETVSLAQQGQYKPDLARSLIGLGRVKRCQGDLLSAGRLLWDGLDLYRELGHKLGVTVALEELAAWSGAASGGAQTPKLYGAARALRQTMGAPLPPVDGATRDSVMARSRSQLGGAAFDAAWAEGLAMSYEQAVDFAAELRKKQDWGI